VIDDADPGPITISPMPRPRRVVEETTFQSLAEPLVNLLGTSDDVLGGHQRMMATNDGAGFEGQFAATIGRAGDTLDAQPDPYADQTAARFVDSGGGVDVHHAQTQRYLPGPEHPIDRDFKEFPMPDFGYRGTPYDPDIPTDTGI
jgi:hypothetical protein